MKKKENTYTTTTTVPEAILSNESADAKKMAPVVSSNIKKAQAVAISKFDKLNIKLDSKQARELFKEVKVNDSLQVDEIVNLYLETALKATETSSKKTTPKKLTKKQQQLVEAVADTVTTVNQKDNSRVNVLFPKSFIINDLKFRRVNDGDEFGFEYVDFDGKKHKTFKFEPIQINSRVKDYSEATYHLLTNLTKKYPKYEIVVAAAYDPVEFVKTRAGKESRYNKDNAPFTLPESVQEVPFSLMLAQITSINIQRRSNAIDIEAVNMYTEAKYTYLIDDFTHKKQGFFKSPDIEFPLMLYIADKSKVKNDKAIDVSQSAMYIDLTANITTKDTSPAVDK